MVSRCSSEKLVYFSFLQNLSISNFCHTDAKGLKVCLLFIRIKYLLYDLKSCFD